ncbi:MAG: 50S ribosomal protein L30 [Actinomycetota bacterium]
MSPAKKAATKKKAAKIRVRQVRSAIGQTSSQRATLRSLGLKHIGDEVIREDRPETRGMARAVPHLVTVEEVD